jgi:hypothetical protein
VLENGGVQLLRSLVLHQARRDGSDPTSPDLDGGASRESARTLSVR